MFKDSLVHKERPNVVKLVKENRMNELKNEFMNYCQHGKHFMVNMLMLGMSTEQRKKLILETDFFGNNCFLYACMFNYYNLIELFMKETFVSDLMGSRDANGNTPFMVCCGNGQNRILDMFIQAGYMDLTSTNKASENAFYQACKFGKIETCKLLIFHGAHIDKNNTSAMRTLHPYYQQDITSYHQNENRWNRRKEFINMLTENSYLQLSSASEHGTSHPNTPAFGTVLKYEKVLANYYIIRSIVSYM
jgi:ankyrin repeat protein